MNALRSLALASALLLVAFAPAQTGTVSLFNASEFVVTNVYISDCGTENWEEDVLGEYILEPGDQLDVQLSDGCWDMMAIIEGEVALDTYSVGVGPGDYIEWTISSN